MFGARCNASTNFRITKPRAMDTPTPWKVQLHSSSSPSITDEDGYSIAKTTNNSVVENFSNAELIVRAVNYHDRLVECLTIIIESDFITGTPEYYTAQQLLTEIKESK